MSGNGHKHDLHFSVMPPSDVGGRCAIGFAFNLHDCKAPNKIIVMREGEVASEVIVHGN